MKFKGAVYMSFISDVPEPIPDGMTLAQLEEHVAEKWRGMITPYLYENEGMLHVVANLEEVPE